MTIVLFSVYKAIIPIFLYIYMVTYILRLVPARNRSLGTVLSDHFRIVIYCHLYYDSIVIMITIKIYMKGIIL